jgi:uncharacterized protein (TIGR02246 family)
MATAVHADPRRPLLVTVDDLPIAAGSLHQDPADRERITQALLAALARHRIPAVGLVTWSNVHSAADNRLLDAWLSAGHELGNHSQRHLQYNRTPIDVYLADVDSARANLTRYLAPHDRTLRFFRFPFLREGNTAAKLQAMRDWLARTGQRNLPVTVDTQDWSFERSWVAAHRVRDQAALDSIGAAYRSSLQQAVRHYEAMGDALLGRRPPQILLLHANAVGAAQWDALFTWLTATGHRFATADEVLADSVYALEPAYVGNAGCSLWNRLLDARRREQAEAVVRAVLAEQAAGWNRGDLEAFCSVYADSALFVSTTGLTRGRDAVLSRYRKRYPDRAAMGTLSLDVVTVDFAAGVEVTTLGDAVPSDLHGASVVARWKLAYPDKEAATGLTLLAFRRRTGGTWEIVHDASM